MVRNGVVVDFGYINGMPATISFNGNTFYYVTNGQGDVTGITDSQRNVLITYYYDAWGSPYCTYNSTVNPQVQNLFDLNPLLYRGYVYDREAGMYYLQSRYYIPSIGRFLNADALVSTGQGILGSNMFAYCGDNPVNRADISGCSWVWFDFWKRDIHIKGEIGRKRILLDRLIIEARAYKQDEYLNEEQMQVNATIIYTELSEKGWSHNAICAVLGNMQQESNINPGMTERGGGSGFGLVQWTPSTKYTNWADANGRRYNSILGQLRFLIVSMQPGAGEWFQNRNVVIGFNQHDTRYCNVSYLLDYSSSILTPKEGVRNVQEKDVEFYPVY